MVAAFFVGENTMSVSKYSICSDACVLIGADPINSFDDMSVESEACKAVYHEVYENLLRHRDWTFTRDYVCLNKLNKCSYLGYKYVYQIPNTVIGVLQGYNAIEYKITNNKELHCNVDNFVAYCKVRPDESQLPLDFVLLMKYAIAADISTPVTENASIQGNFEQKTALQMTRCVNNDLIQEPDTTYFADDLTSAWYN